MGDSVRARNARARGPSVSCPRLAQRDARHCCCRAGACQVCIYRVADGDRIRLGLATHEAIQTPGHTNESTSYLLNAVAVFSGDTLFTNGVGRPDLHADVEAARHRARALFASLTSLGGFTRNAGVAGTHERADCVRRATGHGTGAEVATWLTEWLASESAFVDRVTSKLPPTPPNFVRIVALNEAGEFPSGDLTDLEAGANRCAMR